MDNPLIVHIADDDMLPRLVTEIPETAAKLADAYWPGPLTMIFPKGPCIPDEVSAGLSTVAVRMPSHPVAQALIRHPAGPWRRPRPTARGLRARRPPLTCCPISAGGIAAVVDGGECAVGVESTVVLMTGTRPRLLRPGGITVEMLERVAGPVDVDPAVTNRLGGRGRSGLSRYEIQTLRAQSQGGHRQGIACGVCGVCQ